LPLRHTRTDLNRLVRNPQYWTPRQREQVAAVCYRINGAEIEFLLVLTRSGRWTFPKGGLEPGMTQAQAAAMEAFEEAGVHGRIEHLSFARYVRRRGKKPESRQREIAVHAHLCEVSRQEAPQELNRRPTWFSAEKAKMRLREDRRPGDSESMVRVVNRAVARIQRLRRRAEESGQDALQNVRFEPFELFMNSRRGAERTYSAGVTAKMRNEMSKLLPSDSASLTLEGTSRDEERQVIEINDVRNLTKAKRRLTSPRS